MSGNTTNQEFQREDFETYFKLELGSTKGGDVKLLGDIGGKEKDILFLLHKMFEKQPEIKNLLTSAIEVDNLYKKIKSI